LYYNRGMTLTVRLPHPLEDALEEFSASHGLTKSHVVQEALAEYLARGQREKKGVAARELSANYRALKKAGLIGCVSGDGVSATKDVVHQRVLEQLKSRHR
jgi:predicted transcriptional regulator